MCKNKSTRLYFIVSKQHLINTEETEERERGSEMERDNECKERMEVSLFNGFHCIFETETETEEESESTK